MRKLVKKISFVLLVPFFSFVCFSKRVTNNQIEVVNKLPISVYCVPNFGFSDSSFKFTSKEYILANDSIFHVNAKTNKKLFRMPLTDTIGQKFLLKFDTLEVFVFDENVIKEKSWEEIIGRQLYLKRLTYSFKEITCNNCKVVIK